MILQSILVKAVRSSVFISRHLLLKYFILSFCVQSGYISKCVKGWRQSKIQSNSFIVKPHKSQNSLQFLCKHLYVNLCLLRTWDIPFSLFWKRQFSYLSVSCNIWFSLFNLSTSFRNSFAWVVSFSVSDLRISCSFVSLRLCLSNSSLDFLLLFFGGSNTLDLSVGFFVFFTTTISCFLASLSAHATFFFISLSLGCCFLLFLNFNTQLLFATYYVGKVVFWNPFSSTPMSGADDMLFPVHSVILQDFLVFPL